MAEKQLGVLLLDDEDSLRVPLKKYLEENYHFHVDAVASSKEALHLVETSPDHYDVALLDEVLINESNGLKVMQKIKSRCPNIEVIVFTGWGLKSSQRAFELGAFRYIEKPFELDELAMLIRIAAQQVRLRQIGRAILSERNLDWILESIVSASLSLALADEASIILHDQAGGEPRIYPPVPSAEPIWNRHFRNRNLSEEIIDTGQVVIVSDTMADEQVDPNVIGSGIRSLMGVPVPGEGGNLGVLYVYSRNPQQFEKGGILAVVQTLAGQAGVAIANATAFTQLHSYARDMEALVAAGHGFARSLEQEDLLTLVWEFVNKHLEITTFFVALYNKDIDELSFPVAYDNGAPIQIPNRRLDNDRKRWGVTGHVIKTNKELHWPTSESGKQQLKEIGIEVIQFGRACESCMYFPLRVGDEIIGVVSIQSYTGNAFSSGLMDACRALGNQLAVALENAKLISQLRISTEQLDALIESSFDTIISVDQDNNIKLFNQQAEKMFGWTTQETNGHNINQLWASSAEIEDIHVELNQGKTITARPVQLKRRDGTHIPAELSANLIRDNLGVATGKSFFIRDLRDIRLVENRLETHLEVSQALVQASDLDHVLDRILSNVGRVVSHDTAHIMLLDDGYARVVRTHGYSADEEAIVLDRILRVEDLPPLQRMADLKQPLAISDVRAYQGWQPLSTTDDVYSFAGAPICLEERVIGFLNLNSHTPGFYTDIQAKHLQAFANQAAVAIEYSRLYVMEREQRTLAEALRDTSAVINRTLDQEEVLNCILENVGRIVPLDTVNIAANIMLIEGSRVRTVRTRGYAQWDEKTAMSLNYETKEVPSFAEMIKTKKPLVISDVWKWKEHNRWIDTPETQWIRSYLGVPILLEEEVIGFLNLDSDIQGFFNLSHSERLEAFAHQAAIAIKNARLHTAEQTLRKATATLNETLQLTDVLQTILRQFQIVVPYSSASVQVVVGETLEIVACAGFDEPQMVKGLSFPANDPKFPQYKILETGEPLNIKDVREEYEHFLREATHYHSGHIRSWLGLPLIVNDEIIGVISIDKSETDPYTEKQVDLAVAFANQAATAIAKSRLFEQIQDQRAKLVSAITEISTSVSTTLKPKQVLDRIAGWMTMLLGTTHSIGIAWCDYDTDESVVETVLRRGENVEGKYRRIPLNASVIGGIVRHRETMVFSDLAKSPDVFTFFDETRSLIIAPMLNKDALIGILSVEHDLPNMYTPEDARLAGAIASLAGVAIENAKLYTSLAHRLDQLTTIHEISEAVPAFVELSPFLQALLDLSLEHLAVPAGTIQLLDTTQNELVVRASVGSVSEELLTRIPVSEELVGQAIREQRLVYEPHDKSTRGPYRSKLAAPLKIGNEILGAFVVQDSQVNSFDKEKRELFELIVEHAAVALHQKIRLSQEEDKRVKAERDAILGKFTQHIAHHVKNNVGIIRLKVINLLADYGIDLGQVLVEELEHIKHNAEMTISMAERLFEPYKKIEPEEVDVNWLIKDALNVAATQADIEIKTSLDEGLPKVAVDQLGMVGVFQELIINACKAVRGIDEEKWIRVSSQRSIDSGIDISFSNNGPPIPREQWNSIFEQFKVVEEKFVSDGGFGIGLWSARVFLERHGGHIRVSESDLDRTTFLVHLPEVAGSGES